MQAIILISASCKQHTLYAYRRLLDYWTPSINVIYCQVDLIHIRTPSTARLSSERREKLINKHLHRCTTFHFLLDSAETTNAAK